VQAAERGNGEIIPHLQEYKKSSHPNKSDGCIFSSSLLVQEQLKPLC